MRIFRVVAATASLFATLSLFAQEPRKVPTQSDFFPKPATRAEAVPGEEMLFPAQPKRSPLSLQPQENATVHSINGLHRYYNDSSNLTATIGYMNGASAGGAKFYNGGSSTPQILIATDQHSYFSAGNDYFLGVNTTTPIVPLSVEGSGYSLLLGQSKTENGAKQLLAGYDYANNYGVITAMERGVTYTPLALQPFGGRVGIGSITPISQLSVSGDGYLLSLGEVSGAATSRQLLIGYAMAGDYGMLTSVHNGSGYTPLALQKDGGRVGIGTSVPSAHLHINGGGDTSQWKVTVPGYNGTISALSYGPNNASIAFDSDFQGNTWIARDTSAAWLYKLNGTFRISAATGATIGGGVSPATKFELDLASGSVGIGAAPVVGQRLRVGGTIHATGDITADGAIQAKYQDVAEWVPSASDLADGTVVILDTTATNRIMASAVAYDTKVAGVVSAQPGLILGEAAATKEKIATTGRVRIKVDATKNPIRVGDLLVTSDRAGHAMRSEPMEIGGRAFHQPGTIIGKALEPLEGGHGEILVLLSLQ